jgi:hypothetical protein
MKAYGVFGVFVLMLACQPAGAQVWKEYSFEAAGFWAQYQGEPKVEERPYASALASSIVQRIYSHNSGGVDYRVVVADFAGAQVEKNKAIDEAANALIARGKLTHNSTAYLNAFSGREIRVEALDGTSYTSTIFFINNRLFQIGVVYPPMNSDPAGSSGIHFFLQSFHLVH